MSKHYDTLETRTPAEREKALMQALPQQIAHAKANAPFFKEWLKDVDPAAVTSREALARLPVLRKSMLGEVTAAASTSFSQSLKNGALALAWAICCGRACISAFSRSAGVRVSSVS